MAVVSEIKKFFKNIVLKISFLTTLIKLYADCLYSADKKKCELFHIMSVKEIKLRLHYRNLFWEIMTYAKRP